MLDSVVIPAEVLELSFYSTDLTSDFHSLSPISDLLLGSIPEFEDH